MREDDDNDNDIKTTIRQISSQNSCKDAQTTTTKSPQHFLKRDQTGAGDFKPPPAFPDEDANVSLCSGSQSLISRHSELSSLTGARLTSGMFYGGQPASAAICPFPEDWQQTIPEVIENDEEID